MENDFNPDTQNHDLLEYLKIYRYITGLEASIKLGIGHLPRRIKDLKEKGVIIDSDEWKDVLKANGKIAHVKNFHYSDKNFAEEEKIIVDENNQIRINL